MENEKLLYRINDIAKTLNIHPRTVRRKIATLGIIPIKYGLATLISKEDAMKIFHSISH